MTEKIFYQISEERGYFLRYFVKLYIGDFRWDMTFAWTLKGAKKKGEKMLKKYLNENKPNIIYTKKYKGGQDE